VATVTFEYSKELSPHGQEHGLQQRVEAPGRSSIDYGTLREVENAFLDWFRAEHPTQALIEWKATTEADEVLSHYRAHLPYGTPKFPATDASAFFEQSQERPSKATAQSEPRAQHIEEATTEQEKQILSEYQLLMNEVKYRLKLVLQLIKHDAPYPEGIVKEFCFLQIRMVCELVGLGCLLAHGGIKGAQTLQLKKAYSPERIISELEKLHPNFFPEAFIPIKEPDGGLAIAEVKPGYLTKGELVKLHGLCGQVLHRGSIERFLARAHAPLTSRKETIEWTEKLLKLLDHHIIFLSGMDKAIACAVRVSSNVPVTTMFFVARAQ
jgi:hypothetical protein